MYARPALHPIRYTPVALAVLALAGCAQPFGSGRPVSQPSAPPASIAVEPRMAAVPVNSEQTLTAVMRDKDGKILHSALVEWTMARTSGAVGDILSVQQDELNRALKVDNTFAISGVRQDGTSAITITSPVEGISRIIAYAPDIKDPALNKVILVRHWLDAKWELPAASTSAKVGTVQPLVAKVTRQSDGTPLAGYEVNWQVTSGPEANFVSSGKPVATTLTDDKGEARVELAQVKPAEGENTVAVTLSRSGNGALSCCPVPTGTFASGQTQALWMMPALNLQKSCPDPVPAGEAGQFSVTVSNPSKVASDAVVVQETVPAVGVEVLSAPGAQVVGNTLTWDLGSLDAGASRNLTYTARAAQAGAYAFKSTARTGEGLTGEAACTIQTTVPLLSIGKSCPAEGQVGDKLEYTVTVTNKGSGAASNVVVTDKVPAGMSHESGQPEVTWKVDSLAPGASATERFVFTANQTGTTENVAVLAADKGLSGGARCATAITQAALSLTKVGPETRFVGRPASYAIAARNSGNAAATNVVLTDNIPAGMAYESSDPAGSHDSVTKTVSWNLGTLDPGATKTVNLTLKSESTGKPCNTATVTADRGHKASAEACTELSGIPALLLEVVDSPDPVEVGSNTTYTITVTNQGTADATNVLVQAMLADGEELVSAGGSSTAEAVGPLIRFVPVASLAPGKSAEFKVEVKAARAAGDVRFRVMMNADQLSDGVREEESTRLY